jgi:hypothetical protein
MKILRLLRYSNKMSAYITIGFITSLAKYITANFGKRRSLSVTHGLAVLYFSPTPSLPLFLSLYIFPTYSICLFRLSLSLSRIKYRFKFSPSKQGNSGRAEKLWLFCVHRLKASLSRDARWKFCERSKCLQFTNVPNYILMYQSIS